MAVITFAAIIGFGGASKNQSTASDGAVPSSPGSPSSSATSDTPSATAIPLSTRSSSASPTPTLRPRPTSTSTGLGTSDASLKALTQRARTQPVRIRIPALHVDAPIIPAGVDASGALAVPTNVVQAAWFQAGSAPGQPGTAIIAAHVDFNGKLGLFNGLHTLPRGTAIYVTDVSGKTRRFTAVSGQLAPKSDPSTVQALAEASTAGGATRLALITCGGDLNYAKHSYYDNFVLLANL